MISDGTQRRLPTKDYREFYNKQTNEHFTTRLTHISRPCPACVPTARRAARAQAPWGGSALGGCGGARAGARGTSHRPPCSPRRGGSRRTGRKELKGKNKEMKRKKIVTM